MPAPLAAVVSRALQLKPVDRYPTAAGFADALEEAAADALGPGAIAATGVPIHRTEPVEAPPDRPTLVENSPGDLMPPPKPPDAADAPGRCSARAWRRPSSSS